MSIIWARCLKLTHPLSSNQTGRAAGFRGNVYNMTRYALLFALLVGGCSFGIDKLNAAGGDGVSDLGTEDSASTPPDLTGVDPAVDLAEPSDLVGVFSPSHV